MAVNEKRGSRKRESTGERDAKERVRVLKITEWIIIRVNRSDPNAHTHKKERERENGSSICKKTKILCGRGRGDRHSQMKPLPNCPLIRKRERKIENNYKNERDKLETLESLRAREEWWQQTTPWIIKKTNADGLTCCHVQNKYTTSWCVCYRRCSYYTRKKR